MTENNVLINNSEIFLLNSSILDKLKKLAQNHPLKRARFCLHESLDNKVHEMIIVAHRDGAMEPHKHPSSKPESYHVIEGKLKVLIFDRDGTVKEEFLLDEDKHPKMYRIQGGVWHQPVPLTEWVVYHEVATGPFNKEKDVIFFGDI